MHIDFVRAVAQVGGDRRLFVFESKRVVVVADVEVAVVMRYAEVRCGSLCLGLRGDRLEVFHHHNLPAIKFASHSTCILMNMIL